MLHIFRTVMTLPLQRSDVFPFFAEAENLEQITPPELQFQIVSPRPAAIHEGALITYRLRLMGIPFLWVTRIARWEPPDVFVDEQLRGPYREWVHTHRFEDAAGGTRIEDEVRYRLPLFPFGELAYPVVQMQIKRIFAYRHTAIRRLLTGQG